MYTLQAWKVAVIIMFLSYIWDFFPLNKMQKAYLFVQY